MARREEEEETGGNKFGGKLKKTGCYCCRFSAACCHQPRPVGQNAWEMWRRFKQQKWEREEAEDWEEADHGEVEMEKKMVNVSE